MKQLLAISFLFLWITACTKNLVVENVDYSQPLESVVTPDVNGDVDDIRYAISFNIHPFLVNEYGEEAPERVDEVRIIRDRDGYYYITASGFKHVYVMKPQKASLKLIKQVMVSETGFESPAFNSRAGEVEVIDTVLALAYTINHKGIKTQEDSQ